MSQSMSIVGVSKQNLQLPHTYDPMQHSRTQSRWYIMNSSVPNDASSHAKVTDLPPQDINMILNMGSKEPYLNV